MNEVRDVHTIVVGVDGSDASAAVLVVHSPESD